VPDSRELTTYIPVYLRERGGRREPGFLLCRTSVLRRTGGSISTPPRQAACPLIPRGPRHAAPFIYSGGPPAQLVYRRCRRCQFNVAGRTALLRARRDRRGSTSIPPRQAVWSCFNVQQDGSISIAPRQALPVGLTSTRTGLFL
jgi:hypothetical protein